MDQQSQGDLSRLRKRIEELDMQRAHYRKISESPVTASAERDTARFELGKVQYNLKQLQEQVTLLESAGPAS